MEESSEHFLQSICAPKLFKSLIGRITVTFPPIDLAPKDIQIFNRRILQNIHQNISSKPFDYKTYSNFWSEDFSKHFLQSIWAPTIFKILSGGIIRTFPPINLCMTNIQIVDWRNHQNISSNRFGYNKYSNFWLEDFSKHFLQSICAPKISKLLIGGIIRPFPPIDLARKMFKFWIRGFLKTFHPVNFGTNNIQILDWKNHQNISSNRLGYKKYSHSWSQDCCIHFL